MNFLNIPQSADFIKEKKGTRYRDGESRRLYWFEDTGDTTINDKKYSIQK